MLCHVMSTRVKSGQVKAKSGRQGKVKIMVKSGEG